ncbi:putative monocarboxylate transporter mch1 [Ascosphaera aggregata]|nr:putative monocarboxylate transporter mch1 [Ascosphaera aggregata]
MFPAAGAAFWGMVYSIVYDRALKQGSDEIGGKCAGWDCYGTWAVGSTISIELAQYLDGIKTTGEE